MYNINKGFRTLSVFYILFGLALLFNPGLSTGLICQVLGWGLTGVGVVRMVQYFTGRSNGGASQSELATGALLALGGVVVLLNARSILAFLPFLFGVAMLVHSVATILNAQQMRRAGAVGAANGALAGGALCAVLAFIILANPFGTVLTLVRFIGISMVINGVSNLGSSVRRR
ncbi:DUF308 domain-containing protein [Ruminococcaceae bacterium OttesenSCG-928-N02]|nr:DUF308 domain-containing protein [Ruminococcaceae bacterium OttesenSCG-928-N02]